MHVALTTQGEDKEKNNDSFWFLKASKNGINSTLGKAWKWVSRQNDTLYSIDNCTNDANRQTDLAKLKYDRLGKGENIDVSEVKKTLQDVPETVTGAMKAAVSVDLAFIETVMILPKKPTFFNKIGFGKTNTPKVGKVVIETGAKYGQMETNAANVFGKNGYDVTIRVTANDKGIKGVQTSDFIVETFGKVELYSPVTDDITNITREIVKKKGQANILAVTLKTDSIAVRQEIVNRVFGKPEAKSITRLLFIVEDKVFSYTRLK